MFLTYSDLNYEIPRYFHRMKYSSSFQLHTVVRAGKTEQLENHNQNKRRYVYNTLQQMQWRKKDNINVFVGSQDDR